MIRSFHIVKRFLNLSLVALQQCTHTRFIMDHIFVMFVTLPFFPEDIGSCSKNALANSFDIKTSSGAVVFCPLHVSDLNLPLFNEEHNANILGVN